MKVLSMRPELETAILSLELLRDEIFADADLSAGQKMEWTLRLNRTYLMLKTYQTRLITKGGHHESAWKAT